VQIQDVASQTGLSVHALRYYEQIGLVTPIHRAENGHRAYTEDDVYRIQFVMHLRSAGMPIADIKRYVELAQAGDDTLCERQIDELNTHLDIISMKISHYRETYLGLTAGRG
jgi:DNA-binding transcriptional MerR regulator